ncbi:MAG: hypothetical protein EZS28_014510 [Streblomastix strix]|uniref:Uncharacterized protein n=1 Tax=Streblomastix strix TaxID=222440 RepID=A0A5J4W4R0_9EUKA|nr:MAG: hypothetical protein EZS28_014510 [Streblomastix strix]
MKLFKLLNQDEAAALGSTMFANQKTSRYQLAGSSLYPLFSTKETYYTPIWEQYSEIQESKKNVHIIQIVQLIILRLEEFYIDVSGIFVIECHFAVGSGISITKILMELTDSVFIEPSCYSNMIYLKRTLGTIEDYAFTD